MVRLVAAVALVAVVSACPPSGAPVVTPPSAPPPGGYQPGAAVGAACDVHSDCASGICEGQGCGVGQGVCAARERACTFDAPVYCGCDGQTFQASGTCPGRRFAARGPCDDRAVAPLATGAACLEASQCASGVCEGRGCGPDAPGVCAPANRVCTTDARSYCGCDGVTFTGSGSCPGRRYAAPDACAR